MVSKEQAEMYAHLKEQEAGLKNQIKFLNVEICEEMTKDGLEKVPTPIGVFEIRKKRKYTYPPEVILLEEQLDKMKTEAEAVGTATYDTTSVLYFLKNKNEQGEEEV